MLQSISWSDYCLTMGVSLVVYYGWWLVKYAPTLHWLQARLTRPVADDRMNQLVAGINGTHGHKASSGTPGQEPQTADPAGEPPLEATALNVAEQTTVSEEPADNVGQSSTITGNDRSLHN